MVPGSPRAYDAANNAKMCIVGMQFDFIFNF